MRALNLYGVNDLRLDEVSRPVRQPGEVLLRVRAVGICGSDIPRVFVKGTYHFPTIIGHEFAGEIIEADDGDAALIGRGAAVFLHFHILFPFTLFLIFYLFGFFFQFLFHI